MNIQIFGKSKCFDTKKAQRYFKERGIKFQMIEVDKFGMSNGEYESIKKAVGGFENLVDTKSKDYEKSFIAYLASEAEKEDKLFENPKLFLTPIVRNKNKATIGFAPDIWKEWEQNG